MNKPALSSSILPCSMCDCVLRCCRAVRRICPYSWRKLTSFCFRRSPARRGATTRASELRCMCCITSSRGSTTFGCCSAWVLLLMLDTESEVEASISGMATRRMGRDLMSHQLFVHGQLVTEEVTCLRCHWPHWSNRGSLAQPRALHAGRAPMVRRTQCWRTRLM